MTTPSKHRAGRIGRAAVAAIGLLCGVLAATTAAADDPYRVGPGDILAVSIFGEPALSGSIRVRESGGIALHLLGDIPVTGRTVEEIEDEIVARATQTFGNEISVVVALERARDIYVLGAVARPGAYEFRNGLTVIKAVAMAGGFTQADGQTEGDWRFEDVRRQAMQARTRLHFAEARLAALDAEIARLEGSDPASATGADTGRTASGPLRSNEDALIGLRRAILEQSIESSERQSDLARQEAVSFAERRQLIDEQLEATQGQLENIERLVNRGHARRELLLELQVDAAAFRADGLEATAFEARARQTAANAESSIVLARKRYHQDLMAERITAQQGVETARADYVTSLSYLQSRTNLEATPALQEMFTRHFEIYRDGGERSEPMAGDLTTRLVPGDVLMIRLEMLEPAEGTDRGADVGVLQ